MLLIIKRILLILCDRVEDACLVTTFRDEVVSEETFESVS